MYCSQRNIKTSAAKEWSCQVLHALNAPQITEDLKELREAFDPKKNGYEINLIFNYPKNIFRNKEGEISSRTMDITNIEKPLIDLLFLCKYFDLESPYGAKNLNIDDKYLTKMVSEKRSSDIYSIEIVIKILDLILPESDL